MAARNKYEKISPPLGFTPHMTSHSTDYTIPAIDLSRSSKFLIKKYFVSCWNFDEIN